MLSRSQNRILWAVALLGIVYFALKAQGTLDAYFIGVGTLSVSEDQATDTVYLSWRGRIDAPMEARLREAFEKHRNARNFVLALASPGGAIDHGSRVARLLQQVRDTHNLTTRVDADKPCASMCVPVYLQGGRRTAAADARFMFHEVSFREEVTDEAVAVPQSATETATDRLFSRFFVPAGVSQAWIKKVRAEMAGGNDVWLTGQQLVTDDAGIVQELRN